MQYSWPLPSNPNNNQLIANRYRLQRSLGKGSFGEVFFALDTKYDPPREVALKIIQPQFLQDYDVRENIKREASTLARLDHPNILQILEFEVTAQQAYIITKYAAGGSLKDKIRPEHKSPNPLPLDQVTDYLEQIADALDEAHNQGLIHRDIKSENILLDKSGRPLLADFGLAITLTNPSSSRLINTEAWGTPDYAAPEVWNDQVGKPSDIYALGVLLYEMLTGQLPFQDGQYTLKWQHLNSPVPNLSKYIPKSNYPAGLDEVIAAALDKDAGKRIKSAGELYRRFVSAVNVKTGRKSGGYNPAGPTLPALTSTELAKPAIKANFTRAFNEAVEVARKGHSLDTLTTGSPIKAHGYKAGYLHVTAKGPNAEKAYQSLVLSNSNAAKTTTPPAPSTVSKPSVPQSSMWPSPKTPPPQHGVWPLTSLPSTKPTPLDEHNAAINRDPANPKHYYNRGLYYYRQLNYFEAGWDFEKATKLDNRNASYHFWRAKVYESEGDNTAAFYAYERAFKLDPKYPNLESELQRIAKLLNKVWPNTVTNSPKPAQPTASNTTTSQSAAWPAAQSKSVTNPVDNLMQQLTTAEAKSDWSVVIRLGQAVLKLDAGHSLARSKLITAYWSKGFSHYIQKQYTEAISDLTCAIELKPQEADYYFWRGKANYALNNLTQTIADNDLAIKYNPDESEYLNQAAKYYAQTKNNKISITSDPQNAEKMFEKAKQHYANREFDLALDLLVEAIKLKPGNASYYFWRAKCLAWTSDDNRQAIADFARAVELAPSNQEYLAGQKDFLLLNVANSSGAQPTIDNNLLSQAQLHYQQGNYQEVIKLLTIAITSNPTVAEYYFWRGRSYYQHLDLKLDLIDFDRAIQIDNKRADYYGWRAISYMRYSNYDKAIADSLQAIKLDPTKAEYYFCCGRNYFHKGQYNEASGYFEKSIVLAPAITEYYSIAAENYSKLKSYALAVNLYSKAIKLNPQKAEYYFARSEVYMLEVKVSFAILDLNQAILNNPNNKDYYYARGIAHERAKDKKAAREDFKRAQELGHKEAKKKLGLFFGKIG